MNLASVLLARAIDDPGAVALRTEAGTVTYGELDERSARLAGALRERLAPATRVALVAGNGPAFVVGYLASLRAGMIAVPLDPTAPALDLSRSLAIVGAGLVVVSEAHREHRGLVDRDVVVLAPDGRVSDGAGSSAAAPSTAEVDPGDPAVLLFTSGTAGAPKPAILTHGSLAANLDQVQRHPGLAIRSDDVGLGLLPFFHIFGLNVALGLPLAAGASVALIERFDPAGSVARVRDAGVTVIAGVPAVFSAWLDLPEASAPRDAFARVRLAVSGAAALPVETAAAMYERFGVDVREGYGLTEASPIVATAALGGPARPGSIGPPLPGVEVRLVELDGADAEGTDVLVGDPGEVWVRGPNVFAGYWEDSEATARVLDADGWLHTGDLAIVDDDGWLRLVDRAKDLIIVSGFNVYPAEVEDALVEHPDVAEAAVVGVADPRSGETVVAFVVPCEGATPTWTELTAHLRRRLARYKVPSRIELVAELPHNFAGKVPRRALRALAGRGTDDATANPA